MTQRPADDERLLSPPYTGPSKERIYLRDLAEHLLERLRVVRAIAKRHGWLRHVTMSNFGKAWYVSPYAAQRIIVYIRAQQGEKYMRGEQVHEWRERERNLQRRNRLAISRAGTEDRASVAPANIGIAETPAVCMDVEPASAGRLRG